jgi:hypothetical protein
MKTSNLNLQTKYLIEKGTFFKEFLLINPSKRLLRQVAKGVINFLQQEDHKEEDQIKAPMRNIRKTVSIKPSEGQLAEAHSRNLKCQIHHQWFVVVVRVGIATWCQQVGEGIQPNPTINFIKCQPVY